jgi:hypothetical protein
MAIWDKLIVLAAYVLVMFYSGLVADTFIYNEEAQWHPGLFLCAWAGLGLVGYWALKDLGRTPEPDA